MEDIAARMRAEFPEFEWRLDHSTVRGFAQINGTIWQTWATLAGIWAESRACVEVARCFFYGYGDTPALAFKDALEQAGRVWTTRDTSEGLYEAQIAQVDEEIERAKETIASLRFNIEQDEEQRAELVRLLEEARRLGSPAPSPAASDAEASAG